MLLVSGVYYNLYNVLQDEKGAAVNATAPFLYKININSLKFNRNRLDDLRYRFGRLLCGPLDHPPARARRLL